MSVVTLRDLRGDREGCCFETHAIQPSAADARARAQLSLDGDVLGRARLLPLPLNRLLRGLGRAEHDREHVLRDPLVGEVWQWLACADAANFVDRRAGLEGVGLAARGKTSNVREGLGRREGEEEDRARTTLLALAIVILPEMRSLQNVGSEQTGRAMPITGRRTEVRGCQDQGAGSNERDKNSAGKRTVGRSALQSVVHAVRGPETARDADERLLEHRLHQRGKLLEVRLAPGRRSLLGLGRRALVEECDVPVWGGSRLS